MTDQTTSTSAVTGGVAVGGGDRLDVFAGGVVIDTTESPANLEPPSASGLVSGDVVASGGDFVEPGAIDSATLGAGLTGSATVNSGGMAVLISDALAVASGDAGDTSPVVGGGLSGSPAAEDANTMVASGMTILDATPAED